MAILFNRKNTFNGIAYKDDWAIFAWDLFNEPRCPAAQSGVDCTDKVTKWGNEMFAYARMNNELQGVVRVTSTCLAPDIRSRMWLKSKLQPYDYQN